MIPVPVPPVLPCPHSDFPHPDSRSRHQSHLLRHPLPRLLLRSENNVTRSGE